MGDWKVITSPLGMRDVVVFDDGGWKLKNYISYSNLLLYV